MNTFKPQMKRALSLLLTLATVFGIIVCSMNMTALAEEATTPVTIAEWRYTQGVVAPNSPATGGLQTSGSAFTNSQGVTTIDVDNMSSPGLRNWATATNAANGGTDNGYWQFALSSKDYENLTFSAMMRCTTSAPRNWKLQYSTDGISFTDIPNSNNAAFPTTSTSNPNYLSSVYTDYALPSGLDDQELLFIRITMRDRTVPGLFGIMDGGTIHINDVVVKGDFTGTVEEPDPDQVAAVTAEPGSGAISQYTRIALACATDGAMIKYTLNGVDYIDYEEAFSIESFPAEVTAYAVKEDLIDSATVTFSYTLQIVPKTQYDHYYGVLHGHTGYSDNNATASTPATAFNYARNVAGVDFLAITDHSDYFDVTANLGDLYTGGGSQGWKWEQGLIQADENNADGEFVAIYAFEMTWPGMYPSPGFGHINTFNTSGYVSTNNSRYTGGTNNSNAYRYFDDLVEYNDAATSDEGSINMFNHPTGSGYVFGSGGVFGDFNAFAGWTPERNKVMHLIEIGNGSNQRPTPLTFPGVIGAIPDLLNSVAYIRMEKDYNIALEKGWHLAPTNNQDNHQPDWGSSNTHRTVILAEELSREAIYDAMRNRRAYATENENMKVDFTINGEVMGTILDYNPQTLDISVSISNTRADIGSVSLVAGNRFANGSTRAIQTTTFASMEAEWNLSIDAEYDYYYIRIQQPGNLDDGWQLTFTAPIWVTQGVEAVTRLVTFDYNDGETEEVVVEVLDGEPVAKPEDPVKEGYAFNGWLLGSEAYDFDAPVTADITLQAGWEELSIYV